MGDTRAIESLERGIETAKSGNKLLARLHLLQAVELAPQDPNCWLWLAWVAESPASAIHSLKRVLDEQPDHELAQLGIRWATAMADFEYQEYNTPAVCPDGDEVEVVAEQQDTDAEGNTAETAVVDESEQEWPGESYDESESDSEADLASEDQTSDTVSEQYTSDEVDDRQEAHGESKASESDDWFNQDASVLEDDESAEDCTLVLSSDQDELQSLDEDSEQYSASETETTDEKQRVSGWWQEDEDASEQSEVVAEESHSEAADEEAHTEVAEESTSWYDSESHEEDIAEETTPDIVEQVEAPAAEANVAEYETAGDEAEEVRPEEIAIPAMSKNDTDYGVSVLVVDDSPTVRKLVTMTLEKNGFSVASAADGVVALKSIAEMKPRLILLDITMPRLGGYQLCKLIKKHESTKHIPVIMLSGKDGMFDKVRGKFVGCDDYITKPFDPDVLVDKVSTQLTEHYGVAATQS